MKVQILQGISGADQARGIAVVIDVFRAFTVEAVFLAGGARTVLPAGSLEQTEELRRQYPQALTAGERDGRQLPGFDFGNSPAAAARADVREKIIIHTTSAGTQGILHAAGAERIFAGALINARATASVIRALQPEEVSLIAMGDHGTRPTPEDTLCAQYLQALLEERPMPQIRAQADALRYSEGRKFFDPARQDTFPQADFAYCVDVDALDFAIEVCRENGILKTVRRRAV